MNVLYLVKYVFDSHNNLKLHIVCRKVYEPCEPRLASLVPSTVIDTTL